MIFYLFLFVDILQHIRREIVQKALKYGLILTPEALDYFIYSDRTPEITMKRLREKGISIVRLEDIEGEKEEHTITISEVECSGRVRITPLFDEEHLVDSIDERRRKELLINRLETLREFLFRSGGASYTTFSRAKRGTEEKRIAALITSIKNGYILAETEEEQEVIRANNVPEYLGRDMVVGLQVKPQNNQLILTGVTFPGSMLRFRGCERRILFIPHFYRYKDRDFPPSDITVVVGVLDVFRDANYSEIDELLSQRENVYVAPHRWDAVRMYPPFPPLDKDLPSVHNIPSPTILRVDDIRILVYDGLYNEESGKSVAAQAYSRLVQPDISTIPYLSIKDGIMERLPNIILSPHSVLSNGIIYPVSGPMLIDLKEGKVIPL